MTTIATDGKTIALDTLNTYGGQERCFGHTQKWRIVNNVFYCSVGTYGLLDPFIEWHSNGADLSDKPDLKEDWEILVYDKGVFYEFPREIFPYHTIGDPPLALGSGRKYALGAMMMGASPREAVEVAIRLDCMSGGKIDVIDLTDLNPDNVVALRPGNGKELHSKSDQATGGV